MKQISDEERRHKHYRGPRKKKKKMDVISTIILIIAVIVFVFAAYKLITSLLPYIQGHAEYSKVRDLIIDNSDDTDDTDAAPEEFTVDFDELLTINADTVAWLRFDEPSIISYPVVHCKDNVTYLNKSFQANDNKLGALFVDADNKADFNDRDTIIYGHNLSYGGEMFSQLSEYKSQEFCTQHPYFYIYTPNGKVSTYQIFAVGVVKDTSEQYIKTFNTDEEFQSHIDLIRSEAAYDVQADVNLQSRIVSLSTCTNVNEDERFIVHGVKIDEKDFRKK